MAEMMTRFSLILGYFLLMPLIKIAAGVILLRKGGAYARRIEAEEQEENS